FSFKLLKMPYTCNAAQNWVLSEQLEGIFKSLKENARTYFPAALEAAMPTIDDHRKYCVRSWTPTGLGVFETIPTKQGGKLIITGGNNTGGFTQAPVIGEAVLAALDDKPHRMHELFHPSRLAACKNAVAPAIAE
ncbi:MAG: hypothetical protein AAFQ98_14630, partial [Bacteroidota bacterium]